MGFIQVSLHGDNVAWRMRDATILSQVGCVKIILLNVLHVTDFCHEATDL